MVAQSDWLPIIMATDLIVTDFASGGATRKLPCAKEAPDYRPAPWRYKAAMMMSPVIWLREIRARTAAGKAGAAPHADEPISLPAARPRLFRHPGRPVLHRAGAALGALCL